MLYLLLDASRRWLIEHDLYGFFSVLDQIQFRALASAGLAFLLVVLLGRPTIAWLVRKKVGDSGLTDAAALRQVASSKANTPTMGGILVVGAIAASTLLLGDISKFYLQLGLVVLIWLAALGSIDDWLKLTSKSRGNKSRQGLFAWEKLVFQLGLGLLVGYFAFRHGNTEAPQDLAHVLNLPFQKTYDSPASGTIASGVLFLPMWAYIMVATLVLTGMSNAVNITDGMDGLASGPSAAIALGLTVLALIAGSQSAAQYLLVPHIPFGDELAVLIGATAGACLGFLWWNCSPAAVFMGDTGSLALGGVIGYTALILRQEVVMLLMSGVFLMEILSVVIQVGYFKMSGGKRVFRCAPFHHHLHLKAWTEGQIVARAWIISVLLVVLALATVKVR
jgi:phospho-N-acetylmuramoyl-pentapeptide-transferase